VNLPLTQNSVPFVTLAFAHHREVAKAVKLRKAKTVVVAPNIEQIESEGGLDDLLGSILKQAEDFGLPVVFALSRKKMGQVGVSPRAGCLACSPLNPWFWIQSACMGVLRLISLSFLHSVAKKQFIGKILRLNPLRHKVSIYTCIWCVLPYLASQSVVVCFLLTHMHTISLFFVQLRVSFPLLPCPDLSFLAF
jgi:hypothetical protein